MPAPPKPRLDQLLVDRGLAESRERAQRLIRAGAVFIGTQCFDKPGARVAADADVRVAADPCPYVSRGGLKLAGALDRFGFGDLAGATALDIGASTGGFTDCLLQRGAMRVWAIDTGRGQLHERLLSDPRVRLLASTNARNMTPDWLQGDRPSIAAIDVSFISLRHILPPVAPVIADDGRVVALVKPQFEAGPADVGKGGVVRDPAVHRRVLEELTAFAAQTSWNVLDLCLSPLLGPAGNVEFFVLLARDPAAVPGHYSIERTLAEAYHLRQTSARGAGASNP